MFVRKTFSLYQTNRSDVNHCKVGQMWTHGEYVLSTVPNTSLRTSPKAWTNSAGYLCWEWWWRHQMKIFSALLAFCVGNSPVTGELPAQRPVTWSFDIFFDLRLNNGWVNNREASDLRHHRSHYNVNLMQTWYRAGPWQQVQSNIPEDNPKAKHLLEVCN